MDLILWRHAEAQELEVFADDAQTVYLDDLERALTKRGEKQALRMSAWLDRQLPEGTRVLASPARRTEQTVLALGRKFKLQPELKPGANADALLALAGWPHAKSPVLIVGHQPTLGQVVAKLLGLPEGECAIKKGAVWWLRSRERNGEEQTVVVTVQSPELL